jgi:hypothetical protein
LCRAAFLTASGVSPRFRNLFFFFILWPAARAVKSPMATPVRNVLENKVFTAITRLVSQTRPADAITFPDDFQG